MPLRVRYHECGIVLQGSEVKSLREGRASLVDGYAAIQDGEIWLHNVHIPEYTQGTWTNHEPRRPRKLLLHRHEIQKLTGRVVEKGLTLVPLRMYMKKGRVLSRSSVMNLMAPLAHSAPGFPLLRSASSLAR